jgi:hypothetical protein
MKASGEAFMKSSLSAEALAKADRPGHFFHLFPGMKRPLASTGRPAPD